MLTDTFLRSIQQNKPLKDVCTFGIGGPSRYFVEVKTLQDMQQAFHFCQQENLRFFILGKGSNCLFDDQGFNGLVILNKIDFYENPSPGVFHVGAGYSFSLLGVQTARQHWAGLEFASGIPCSVGGAIYMNAGANGSETCQKLVSVDFIDPQGKLHHLPKENLHFSYRTSSFQSMLGAIVGATFHLIPSSEARPKQLDIISYRTKTQPYHEKSAGCVFRNPSGNHAGALIEKTNLKGQTTGGAAVSEKHANFLVNRNQATAQDVLTLISLIKQKVKDQFNIELETEIRLIPYEPENP
jgi:UDP-N-acetylmuramate dehydrogenase